MKLICCIKSIVVPISNENEAINLQFLEGLSLNVFTDHK